MKKWALMVLFLALSVVTSEASFNGTWKVIHCKNKTFGQGAFDIQMANHEQCGFHDSLDITMRQRGKKLFGTVSFAENVMDFEGTIQTPDSALIFFGEFETRRPKIGTARITLFGDRIIWQVFKGIEDAALFMPSYEILFPRIPERSEVEALEAKMNPLSEERQKSALSLVEAFSNSTWDGNLEKAFQLADPDFQKQCSFEAFCEKFSGLGRNNLRNPRFYPLGDQNALVSMTIEKPELMQKCSRMFLYLHRNCGWKLKRIDLF